MMGQQHAPHSTIHGTLHDGATARSSARCMMGQGMDSKRGFTSCAHSSCMKARNKHGIERVGRGEMEMFRYMGTDRKTL